MFFVALTVDDTLVDVVIELDGVNDGERDTVSDADLVAPGTTMDAVTLKVGDTDARKYRTASATEPLAPFEPSTTTTYMVLAVAVHATQLVYTMELQSSLTATTDNATGGPVDVTV